MAARNQSLGQFWPYYLGEHARPLTRTLHYFGTIASTITFVWAVASQSWWWLLAVPLFGYGPAWLGHYCIEKNRPATFQAPLWSLISDYRMCGLFLAGRIDRELMKYQIRR